VSSILLHPSRLLQIFAVIALAVTLSACAGRPKPMEPNRPVTVTEVRVMADSVVDAGFAANLEERLEATAGRATRDVGQAASLRVFVRDRGAADGPLSVLEGPRRAATVELLLLEAGTGAEMRSRVIRTSSASGDGDRADAMLISRLVTDIRHLLGLSGYTPHPVGGVKRAVARPDSRDNTLSEEALLADPLLNGMVTPTTLAVDEGPDVGPSIDLSKPLLSTTPAVEPVEKTAPAAIPTANPVPRGLELPSEAPVIETASPDGESGSEDEPCIITIDNDCSDPDSR
jgi:hypothetical protein